MISETDIYDFYYIAAAYAMFTRQDADILRFRLIEIKEAYIAGFDRVMDERIDRYSGMGRLVTGKPPADATTKERFEVVGRSTRTDGVRPNKRWARITESLVKLYEATEPIDMIYWIDRINNLKHNSGPRVINKLRGGPRVIEALDFCHTARSPSELGPHISTAVRCHISPHSF